MISPAALDFPVITTHLQFHTAFPLQPLNVQHGFLGVSVSPPWHGPNICESVRTLCISSAYVRMSVCVWEREKKIKASYSSKQ